MEEKKAELFKAAQTIFSEKGYKNTNIATIAKKANMAVGSFYKYYNSKEEIFLEVYANENRLKREEIMVSLGSIDWYGDAEKIGTQMIRIIEIVFKNEILKQWYKPDTADLLRNYYNATGTDNSSYHQFLIQTIMTGLKNRGISESEIINILKAMKLIIYIDSCVPNNDVDDYEKSMKTLIQYFIEGILK
ncbi:MAG TPA: helix-turn-helix transcriptional regulator [Clostridiaceae bacterium]|nr:helix-turn-helix transcriptional regulator [Clostridiaceae bacterium]